MSSTKMQPKDELRRRIRAPYRVQARLEIIGVTDSGHGWQVHTSEANEWGIRVKSPRPLPRVAVLLQLRAPNGTELQARGWVIHSNQVSVDLWEGGIEFDGAQPLLTATRIDLANYGH